MGGVFIVSNLGGVVGLMMEQELVETPSAFRAAAGGHEGALKSEMQHAETLVCLFYLRFNAERLPAHAGDSQCFYLGLVPDL